MTIHYDSTITDPSSGTYFRGSAGTVTREPPVGAADAKTGSQHHPPKWHKAAFVGAIVAGLAAVTVFVVTNDSGNDTTAVEVGELTASESAQAQRLTEQAAAITDQPTVFDSSITAIEARDAVDQPTVLDSSITAIEARDAVEQPTVLDSSITAIEARDAGEPQLIEIRDPGQPGL